MNRFSWKNLGKELVAWIVVLVPIVSAFYLFVYRHSSPSPAPHSGGNPSISGQLSVVPKTNSDSDDLVVEHHYKATIDGEVVNIPIKTVTSPVVVDGSSSGQLSSGDSSDGVSGASSYTAHYKQELDLTPLLSKYEQKTNWEVGIGIGSHSGDVYYPVSIQRNLSNDRAVEGVVHISDSGKVDGGEVLFKKRF